MTRKLRIVFMGTPDFACPTLEALAESEHEVCGVFTQADKAVGRGHKIQMPPVKEIAIKYDISVYQPDSLKNAEVETLLQQLQPDLIIVIAYGKILPEWILNLPKYGCINLHASILPKYRGAAPIQWSILNGDDKTGITIMQMDKGMDTGDILDIIETDIMPNETSGELFERLAKMGGDNILEVLEKLQDGKLIPIKQNENEASYTQKITKDMGLINWNQKCENINNHIRGYSPWPGSFSYINGERMRIWKAEVTTNRSTKPAGTIVNVEKNSFEVSTLDYNLEIKEIQLDNKKRMSVTNYLQGHKLAEGSSFDEK